MGVFFLQTILRNSYRISFRFAEKVKSYFSKQSCRILSLSILQPTLPLMFPSSKDDENWPQFGELVRNILGGKTDFTVAEIIDAW